MELIDEDVVSDVYAWVVAQRRPSEQDLTRVGREVGCGDEAARAAVAALVERHVLVVGAQGVVAASPEVAIAALVGPRESAHRRAEADLAAERERTVRLRSRLAALKPTYADPLHLERSGGVDVLTDMFAVRALIADLTATCEREIMACQPGGGRPPAALAEALPRDLELLDRGIVLRSLYQHTARFHPATQAYAEEALAAGSQIRTVAEIPGRMIILDRQIAFLPHRDHPAGAIVVREPSILDYLCSAFEQAWSLGSPYRIGPSATRTAATEIRAAILTLMANGLKDEAIAKRLGLSVRACRRHISELLDALDADSRFQAGAIAARSGLLEPVVEQT
ncbi:LuxR C-terminal-related transcriptional regulator [Kitasatospora sp. NBC_01250]|uniref:helix-turn-helix transcriptional regulator n=1 Tax=unclassified Kitasatospora TaxID=2633591 RepID=UPI002E136035|nr:MULTISPECIES: LuxR C-terminal-related transcriptional regulator [unclassified Kitasatospora]WSJ64806.1 LuxR C-terminal-related transcriptional regulator [Kitasatospora sp. NBC_01302]